ncbi:MAG: DUF370 domain-containing protein [Acetobacteraceae bacterium]|nr:DUF370 domain-containing protein [Acetobacteraceae bacterium]
MFLHIGADAIVKLESVVGIFELGTRSSAPATREFLQLARAERRLVEVAFGPPKSFVVTQEAVYLSPISAVTLKKRAGLLGAEDSGGA